MTWGSADRRRHFNQANWRCRKSVKTIRIEPEILNKFCEPNIRTPVVYQDKNPIVRWLYWHRLDQVLKCIHGIANNLALDLGCGNGVLLPTLSQLFRDVVGVDLEVRAATELVKGLTIENVRVLAGNVLDPNQECWRFSYNAVFATSFLEHFQTTDLEFLLAIVYEKLSAGGLLIASTPTENAFYQIGRRVFGYIKPEDHYQSARSVYRALQRLPWKIEKKVYGPCPYLANIAQYQIVAVRK
jgi:2-polyprenyl-3-methyl-5-hydroxy-6-metoxy-1,4-benzoquinol methylase